MAYAFSDATSQHFFAANAISSISPPCTMAIRTRHTQFQNNRALLAMYTDGSSNNYRDFFTTGVGSMQCRSRSTSNADSSVGVAAANTWWSQAGVYVATNSRTAYNNTTAGNTNTSNITGITVDSLSIGKGVTYGATYRGQIAEVAIWSAALNIDELNSLAQGFKPFRIRPQSLLYYVPLVRDVIELRQSIAFTASASSPTLFDHPRVY